MTMTKKSHNHEHTTAKRSVARRMLTRVLFSAVALSTVVTAVGGPVQAADDVTTQATTTVNLQGSTTGWGAGVNLTLDGQLRGVTQRIIDLSGKSTPVYCIQYAVAYNENGVTFSGMSRATSGIASLDRAADLAARSTNIGTTLIGQGATDADRERNKNYEAAAVQLAIWKHTDNFDLTKVNNTTIRTRAVELATLAGSAAEYGTDLAVTSAYSGSSGSRRINVVVRSGGTPVGGVTVTVSGGVSGTIVTDSTGTGTLAVGDDALSANLSASHVIPAGVVLSPPSGQKVITAASTTVSASSVLSIAAAPTTTQPPDTATPTAPPATSKPTPKPGTTVGTTQNKPQVTTPATSAPVTTTTLPSDDPLNGVIQEPNSSSKGRWLVTLFVLLLLAFLAFLAVRIFTNDEDEDDVTYLS